MAKGEAKNVNQQIQQDRGYNQAYNQLETNYQRDQRNEAEVRRNEMYQPTFQGYRDMAATGGITDADKERMRGILGGLNQYDQNIMNAYGAGGGGGGYQAANLQQYIANPNQWNELEGLYRDSITGKSLNMAGMRSGTPYVEGLAKTGGYDPAFLASIGRDTSMLGDIASSGGVDSNAINRVRGGGVFDEFAQTGGYSDYDRANMRARATSGIPAYYDQLKRDAAQAARIGNTTMGASALASRNARNAARDIADTNRNTELDILDAVNKGRQWGAQNLSQSEAGLANLQSQNRLNALGLSTNTQRGMQEFMASMGLESGQWLSQNEKDIQDKATAERKFGIGGLDEITQRRIQEEKDRIAQANAIAQSQADAYNRSVAGARANALEAAQGQWDRQKYMAGQGLNLEEYFINTGNENKLAGLGGLTDMYKAVPGEVNMREGYLAGNRGQEGGFTQNNTGQYAGYNPNISPWDRVTQIAGAALPAVGGAMGGFGGGGNRNVPMSGGVSTRNPGFVYF